MRLVILDRDGVINQESDAYIKTPEEWIPLPGSLAAIARLNKAGFTVAVASNQAGLARGLFDLKTLDAIHARMHSELAKVGGKIDRIFYCPHKPEDNCDCRKPKPGLLYQIRDHYQVPLKDLPFIGDAGRDVAAAQSAGARSIMVLTGRGREALLALPHVEHYPDLAAAADKLIAETH